MILNYGFSETVIHNNGSLTTAIQNYSYIIKL